MNLIAWLIIIKISITWIMSSALMAAIFYHATPAVTCDLGIH
jgi:hypothetical protein